MTTKRPGQSNNPETVGYKLESGDVHFYAFFSEPSFGLFEDSPNLCQQLFGRLSPHGVRLADVKLEAGAGTLGEVQLTVSLLSYSAVVRIHLDYIELQWFNVRAVTEEQIGDVAIAVLEAVKLHAPAVNYQTYTFWVDVHGTVEELSPMRFLSEYVKPGEPKLGPLTGTGVIFYYGAMNERTHATLTVEHSLTVTEGIHIRPWVAWDATRVPVRSLPGLARAFVTEALVGLRLSAR